MKRIFVFAVFIALLLAGTAMATPLLDDERLAVTSDDAYLVRSGGEVWVSKTVNGVDAAVVFLDINQYFRLTEGGNFSVLLGDAQEITVRSDGRITDWRGTLDAAVENATSTICGSMAVRSMYESAEGEIVAVGFQVGSGGGWEVGCDLYVGYDGGCGGPMCEIRSFDPQGVIVSTNGVCGLHSARSGSWLDRFITCDCLGGTRPPTTPRRQPDGGMAFR